MAKILTIQIFEIEGAGKGEDALKVFVTEHRANGEQAQYQLHKFNIEMIAAIGPMDYADAARDVRNQYHYRRDWSMLPDVTQRPTVPTPTISWHAEKGLYTEKPPEVVLYPRGYQPKREAKDGQEGE